ncbi:MAG TPA: alpha/beta hydrolase, partial [Anaerolineae bacterium]|nr:alpha/beta hydrolase [Anaerolineae bacterium]
SFFSTNTFAAQATGSSARPRTGKILEQLGGHPCPDKSAFTCVTLAMPLDHFNPADPRTIQVTFAVLPATGNRKGMFVTATGGPGTAGIAVADSYTAAFDPSIPRRFDIVFFDQRGVALSGGLTCPDAAAAYYQTDWRAVTPQQEAAVKAAARTFSQTCVGEMGNPDILPYLGTQQAVEDLDRFRQIMQDEKLWLYGESYGTQYAQTYAGAHGDHLAGLILDGTVDLTLSGFEFYAQQAQAFNDTLDATLRACNDDVSCADDMDSDAVAAYDHLAARLDRHTLPFRFPLPVGGLAKRDFTFADFEVAASGQMYAEGDRMLFNRALAALASRDDAVPLARLLYLSLGLDPQTLDAVPDPSYSDAIYYAVECQDYGYPGATPDEKADNYLRAGDPIEAAIPHLASLFYGDLPCAYWPNATTNLTRPAPLIAAGIPTLVLGATADPATPVNNGVSVYQHLQNGYLITEQGGPHVIFGRGNGGVDNMVTDFLVKGKVPQQRETTCDGVVADEYVPLAPRTAAAFGNPLDALVSVETEINYLPEYYYWDGVKPADAGCAVSGQLHFEPNGAKVAFNLNTCAFTDRFTVTGTGSYDSAKDRFVLTVITGGRWRCDLKYARTAGNTKVTGVCDGKPVKWEK